MFTAQKRKRNKVLELCTRFFFSMVLFTYLHFSYQKQFFCTFAGTRIVYERAFLMNLKNSPLSRTPPNNVPLGLLKGQPNIPINRKSHPVSGLATLSSPPKHQNNHHHNNNNNANINDDQFDMDM